MDLPLGLSVNYPTFTPFSVSLSLLMLDVVFLCPLCFLTSSLSSHLVSAVRVQIEDGGHLSFHPQEPRGPRRRRAARLGRHLAIQISRWRLFVLVFFYSKSTIVDCVSIRLLVAAYEPPSKTSLSRPVLDCWAMGGTPRNSRRQGDFGPRASLGVEPGNLWLIVLLLPSLLIFITLLSLGS